MSTASALIPSLSVEMAYLVLAVGLLFVHMALQGGLMLAQTGVPYNAGPRDAAIRPSGMAARADRAYRNFRETFPAFAALVLAVEVTGSADGWTGIGAGLYFWGRVAYVPAYLSGIPWLRSALFGVSATGIVILLWGLVL
ncbi:MAPEG family protein [Aurantimonas sp. A3-2-R12]|uniref:MAPEG family protein n=1 Tax=Aurantimonas sp. A3-2-R12 TaxID=3114362 RepID=UPI002E16C4F4|nr:MAPEG family protein [Aurantimonas sp. A3-2-R12]